MSDYIKRGNLMWEGSRMMLPEHVAALRHRNKSAKQAPPPDLTDEDVTEMGIVASESLQHKIPVLVRHWKDGYTLEKIGTIESIDKQLLQIKINGTLITVAHLFSIERV